MSQFTKRVSTSSDDGSKYSSGSWTYSYIRLGSNVTAGFRFTNVTVPKNAIISSAYITATSSGHTNDDFKLKVYGIDEDNTATMSSDPTGRTKTTASVDWDFTSEIFDETECVSSDIGTIVQEIVNRSSWSSGNAMGFLILDDGSDDLHYFYDYSEDTSMAMYIEINYSVSSPSSSISSSVSSSISSSISSSVSSSRSSSVSPSATPSSSISSSISSSPSVSSSVSSSASSSASPSERSDYGLKITKPGYNVNTETDIKNMVFTSARGVLGLKSLVTYSDTTDSNGDISKTQAHGVGYTPITRVSFTSYDGNRVWCPVVWHSIYLNGSRETIEVTETVSYKIDATNIYYSVHVEEYNHDTFVTTDLSGRDYDFDTYIYFNELVETI